MKRFSLFFVVLLLICNVINFASGIPDTTAPDVSISAPPGVLNAPFEVVITFTEEVSDFQQTDVILSGTATAFITSFTTADNKIYTVTITPTTSGTINIDVAADVTKDAADNGNTAAQTASVSVDIDPPTLTITAPNGSAYNPNNASNSFDVEITFSETVSDFTQSDVQLTFLNLESATITSWTPNADNTVYTATITVQQLSDCDLRHDAQGSMNVRVSVPSGAAMDVAGNLNAAKVSSFYLHPSTFLFPLGLSVSVPSDVQTGAFEIGMLFSLSTEDFIQSDVTLSGAAASITGWRQSGTSHRQYYATITPTESGTITITIPEGAAHSAQCNENRETSQTVTVDLPPGVSITVPTDVQNNAFDVSVIFTETVSDFEQNELVLSGSASASITSFTTADNTTYTVTITPTNSGDLTFNIPAGAATDADNLENTAAAPQTVSVDIDAPEVSLSVPSVAQTGAFDVSVIFTETVSDFEQDEIVLSGSALASITTFTTTDNITYTATITPTNSGDLTFNIPAGVATDAANNPNTAATEKTVTVSMDIVVEIPDVNLAAALRNAFSLDTGTSIYKSQMESLTTFTHRADGLSSTRRVYDLTGLEYATNLQELNLRGNAISDTTPLANLTNLTELILSGNRINSISVIKGLTGLEKLYLTSNYISDISGLEDLTALTVLNIKSNPIADNNANRQTRSVLQARSGLTLKIAAFRTSNSSPGVEIFVPTGTLNAAFQVTISFTEVVSDFEGSDITLGGGATATVTSITTTDNIIYKAEITPTTDGNVILNVPADVATDAEDSGNIAATQKTVTVNLPPRVSFSVPSGTQNGAFDVSAVFTEAVSGFEESELVLGGSSTASITSFTTTDNITYSATITPTTDGDVTFNVAASVATDAANNPNTAATQKTVTVSLATTVEIPDATLELIIRDRLDLGEEADITTSHMETLTYISRSGGRFSRSQRIVDLTGLEHATNLQTLNLISHRITDIAALENLTSLTRLDLRNNSISTITVIKNLTNLTYLNLRRNSITDVTALAGLTGLTRLVLRGNPILDTSPLYPLLRSNGGNLAIDIEVSEYPPWDVNEDGGVDNTDSALVTAAIGQTGDNIVNTRTDVDSDGDVDADDLLLVTENIDEPAVEGAAPSVNGNILIQLDAAALENLDRTALQAQLGLLRAESDGSLKYLRAIALLKSVLAATRPNETIILPNYPNPFNPETWIPYHLANASNVRITIYDVGGTVVRQLDLGYQSEGYYTNRNRAAYWNGRNNVGERVASGVYFYQLEADNVSLLRKMVILK